LDYYVLTVSSAEGGVIDSLPDGSPKGWKFHEGMPLTKEFPTKAVVQFTPNFPKARKLVDFQPNILSLLIISPRVQAVVRALAVKNAEFLPLTMKDQKKKVVATDYAIFNVLDTEDAIDLAKSEVVMDTIIDGDIARVRKLVLNRKGIDPDAKIFRCEKRSRLILVREDVKAALEKANLTGCRLVPVNQFDELFA
jgi:hypothetical protein